MPRPFSVVLHDVVRDVGVGRESAKALMRYVAGMSADELERAIELEERRYLLICGTECMAQFVPFEAVQIANDQRGEMIRRAGLTLTAIDVREGYQAVKNKLAERAARPEAV